MSLLFLCCDVFVASLKSHVGYDKFVFFFVRFVIGEHN